MNSILTGASGFLGKNISQFLLAQQYSLLTVGRQASNDIVSNLATEIPVIDKSNIDLVIHVAGKAHSIPKKAQQKQSFFDVNVKGTQNLLQALENSAIPKQFVLISSVSVYGAESGQNITENAPLLATDAYGQSKIQAEKLFTDWCKKNNVVCTILRLPLLVGKNPPGNLGAMISAIKNNYYFNIGQGAAKKSMVLAEDVAKFIVTIAPIGGIYNLTDGEHPSFYQISSTIAKKKIANLPMSLAKIIAKTGDLLGNKAPLNTLKLKKITSDLTFDDSKARKMGWNPQPVLEYLKHNDL